MRSPRLRLRVPAAVAVAVAIAAAAVPGEAAPGTHGIDLLTFTPPAGWAIDQGPDRVALAEIDQASGRYCMIIVFAGLEPSGDPAADFAAWWRSILKQAPDAAAPRPRPARLPSGIDGLLGEGGARIGEQDAQAMLFVARAGARAAPLVVIASSRAAFDAYRPRIDAFLATVTVKGAVPAPAPPEPRAARPGTLERVPPSSFEGGRPRGIFVGTSMLSGKAVCLLFLDGGRVTRSIPEGGLEELDWERHRSEHPNTSGTYTISDGTLTIHWGDGGIHTGPLKKTPNGIEFYGKRYTRPATAEVGQLAGHWQAARSVGEMTVTHELLIGADASFHWQIATHGVVGGRAVFKQDLDLRGKVTIRGLSATFTGDDGTVITRTFQRLPGEPVIAFSIGRDMFARK